jgi:hypothetical protein
MTRLKLALPTVLLASCAGRALAQETFSQTRDSGPQSLVIAYRVKPEGRVALRKFMEKGGVARFEAWKKQGVLKDYHILFNSYLDFETYDMLSFLTFNDFPGVAKWKEIEKQSPGGLPPAALSLIQSAITYSLDAAFQGAASQPHARGKSVFLIIPYDVLIPTDDYLKYAETYVVPQMKGWMEERVLAGYRIYITRYSTERQWGSLFVLEYRDNDNFGKREATVAKIREKLKANPAWLAASQNKQKIRVEKQTIIAEELLQH